MVSCRTPGLLCCAAVELAPGCTGPLDEIHHYDWLNKYRGYNPVGEDAYVIIPSNFKYDALKSFNGHYQAMDTAMIMPQYRSGAHVRNFYILRVHGYQ
jgi:hypothetical protein